jgi:hypothetical protein
MWTKVKKPTSLTGKEPRATFAVVRNRSGHRGAMLLIPARAKSGDKATIYSDGNGKLAFAFGDKGDYSVFRRGPTATSYAVTIPSQHQDRIPFGVTEVSLAKDGDMLVLDLSTLSAA